jgi:hypothetical protein
MRYPPAEMQGGRLIHCLFSMTALFQSFSPSCRASEYLITASRFHHHRRFGGLLELRLGLVAAGGLVSIGWGAELAESLTVTGPQGITASV